MRDWLENSGVGPGVRQDEMNARINTMEREIDTLVMQLADGKPKQNLPAGFTTPLCISCNRPTAPAPEDVLDFLETTQFPQTLPPKSETVRKSDKKSHLLRPQSAPPKRAKPIIGGRWQTTSPVPREPPMPLDKMEMYINQQKNNATPTTSRAFSSPSPPPKHATGTPVVKYRVPAPK